jgi:hypothetical protein
VLVTDLQLGAKLDALGEFEWPSDVELEVRAVADDAPNALLQRLGDPTDAPPAGRAPPLRVRVSNDPRATRETFGLTWVDALGGTVESALPAYVPPGENRTLLVPKPADASKAVALRLEGDAREFDNFVYVAPPPKTGAKVVFIGKDALEDPVGLLYYLDRACQNGPRQDASVVVRRPDEPLAWSPADSPALVVLAAETSPSNLAELKAYLARGGVVLAVTSIGRSETIAELAGSAPFEATEPQGKDLLLREIAFDHPLFSPLAGAQFNDFTKIHFWKHRRISPTALGEPSRVLARFEDGDPAMVERTLDRGRLIVVTSGWSPADSQLARSSKFVPLVSSLIDLGGDPPDDPSLHTVNSRIPLPRARDAAAGCVVRKPDGTQQKLDPDARAFEGSDQPGVYSAEGGGNRFTFAVNLDPSEGNTAPIALETLEQLGCRLTSVERRAVDREHLRQLQNAELEGRQKLWRWLVLATVGVLIIETLAAARPGSVRAARLEGASP